MNHAIAFRMLLGGLAAMGLGLCGRAALADESAPAAPEAVGPDVAAPVAVPAVALTLREGATAVFAGSEIERHVGFQPADAIAGKLVWRHTVENRTLTAGEIAVNANEPVVVQLRVPSLNEGVSIQTELTMSLVDDPPNPRKQKPRATLTQTLWIVDPDAFDGRKKWLAALHLALYDPVGETARVFEKAHIPFAKVASLAGLDQVSEGIVVIGEGVDLTKVGLLGDSMLQLVGRGIPVLCLAPEKGELPFPTAQGLTPLALRFEGDRIVTELDKRLSAAAWTGDGATPAQHLVATAIRGEVSLRVSDQAIGWPWLEAIYPRKTRLILCGYPIVKTWEREAAARYLLARMLENLEQPKETASE